MHGEQISAGMEPLNCTGHIFRWKGTWKSNGGLANRFHPGQQGQSFGTSCSRNYAEQDSLTASWQHHSNDICLGCGIRSSQVILNICQILTFQGCRWCTVFHHADQGQCVYRRGLEDWGRVGIIPLRADWWGLQWTLNILSASVQPGPCFFGRGNLTEFTQLNTILIQGLLYAGSGINCNKFGP